MIQKKSADPIHFQVRATKKQAPSHRGHLLFSGAHPEGVATSRWIKVKVVSSRPVLHHFNSNFWPLISKLAVTLALSEWETEQ